MLNDLTIFSKSNLSGQILIPGDKSITHRSMLLGSINFKKQKVVLHNWLQSLDCISTMHALNKLGVEFIHLNSESLQINSVGLHGLLDPQTELDVGNSGTTIRLLTGILAAQNFSSVITGDASIQRRPMQRIITPLQQMGAKITSANGFAPLHITGGQDLRGIKYVMPMASAQVKSTLLLAGLYAEGETVVEAPSICRDHTEILLAYLASAKNQAIVNINIPGDISAAAFFIVGATIAPGSAIQLMNIGINPTRSAVLEILQRMGANIQLNNRRCINGEWRADITVSAVSSLRSLTIESELIANAIDEIPIICLAAACARGVTVIRGAQELRYKESDRIAAMAQGLGILGIKVSVFDDGLAITGGVISGGTVDAHGDHRIAMTFAMAGLVAQQPILIQNAQNIITSFPDFVRVAQKAGLKIQQENSYA